ncbi:FIG00613121: hypothetical protein [hydrothermal vent metagenome]|uniref:Contractile injection system tube protein N-terminal domain-containing protein n=1 Tax=hydrothermal vent metagenome TaxID=652676 RepID=A0A3B1DH52_9ZZZZ
MPDLSSGLKKKLTISPCTVDDAGSISVDSSKSNFEVMLNPASYSHSLTIGYDEKKTQGQIGTEMKFSAINPEKVNFDIVIDGTGVVNSSSPDVKTQVESLKTIVYTYDGTKHEPNHVRLLWGSLIFFGRLESLSLDYTLFKPSGEPLRAKLKLGFAGAMSKEEEGLKANRSSPDLTHLVEVRSGDTLPLLCHRIYKNSAYYADVARANNLVHFRKLKPGTKLHFPPLR